MANRQFNIHRLRSPFLRPRVTTTHYPLLMIVKFELQDDFLTTHSMSCIHNLRAEQGLTTNFQPLGDHWNQNDQGAGGCDFLIIPYDGQAILMGGIIVVSSPHHGRIFHQGGS